MRSEDMNQDVVKAEINHYTSLLRTKKCSREIYETLDKEIQTSKVTLITFGVDVSQFDFLLE